MPISADLFSRRESLFRDGGSEGVPESLLQRNAPIVGFFCTGSKEGTVQHQHQGMEVPSGDRIGSVEPR